MDDYINTFWAVPQQLTREASWSSWWSSQPTANVGTLEANVSWHANVYRNFKSPSRDSLYVDRISLLGLFQSSAFGFCHCMAASCCISPISMLFTSASPWHHVSGIKCEPRGLKQPPQLFDTVVPHDSFVNLEWNSPRVIKTRGHSFTFFFGEKKQFFFCCCCSRAD